MTQAVASCDEWGIAAGLREGTGRAERTCRLREGRRPDEVAPGRSLVVDWGVFTRPGCQPPLLGPFGIFRGDTNGLPLGTRFPCQSRPSEALNLVYVLLNACYAAR